MPKELPRRDFLKTVPLAAAGTSAGGAGAWLALDSGADVDAVDVQKLRATLRNQGAAVI